ncbi:MAG TPA: hypothetical protein VMM13_17415 [Euzebya sp.]|nr:hypothetical protein [Euzebya sp.]
MTALRAVIREVVGVDADDLPGVQQHQLGREELAALEPEAILIVHGHFDHAADAATTAMVASGCPPPGGSRTAIT